KQVTGYCEGPKASHPKLDGDDQGLRMDGNRVNGLWECMDGINALNFDTTMTCKTMKMKDLRQWDSGSWYVPTTTTAIETVFLVASISLYYDFYAVFIYIKSTCCDPGSGLFI